MRRLHSKRRTFIKYGQRKFEVIAATHSSFDDDFLFPAHLARHAALPHATCLRSHRLEMWYEIDGPSNRREASEANRGSHDTAYRTSTLYLAQKIMISNSTDGMHPNVSHE